MRCDPCGGLMSRDCFHDLRDDTGYFHFEGWRCVNSGEVFDPLVLTHRVDAPAAPYRGRARDRRTWERLVAA